MRRIRVLQLIEDFGGLGGAERVVYDLISNINRDKFEPLVAIVNPKQLSKYYERAKVKIHEVSGRKRLNIKTLKELISVIRNNNIDITHSHLFRMNSYNWIASRICKKPSLASIHGIMADEIGLSARLFSKLAVSYNTKTVVVSEHLRKQFLNTYEVLPDKVMTIYNGFNCSRIENRPQPADINTFRDCYMCSDSDSVIVAIGNVKEIKGYKYLLNAVYILKQTLSNIRLFIAGIDTNKDELGLVDKIEELSLQHNVTFLGSFQNITTLFEVGDVYVSSSLHEGFSLTTLEAMAYGLPVVVTDCGGPAEIVEDGKDGFVVPVANAQALAKATMKILQNKELGHKLGKHGKCRAFENFSINKFIQKHEQLYRELVGNQYQQNGDIYTSS